MLRTFRAGRRGGRNRVPPLRRSWGPKEDQVNMFETGLSWAKSKEYSFNLWAKVGIFEKGLFSAKREGYKGQRVVSKRP